MPGNSLRNDRPWYQAGDRAINALDEGLRYYLGPAYQPIQMAGNFLSMLSPGADMIDMQQESDRLMRSRGGWDTVDAGLGLGAATMGMAIPGTAKGITEGVDEAAGAVRKIVNGKGQKIDPPRVFYRGTNPSDERRIATGADDWDSHLFAADNEDAASSYGSSIERLEAAPDAKILYEGTADWNRIAGKPLKDENLLQYADRASKAVKAAGYDAAWFKRQGDVGTAIFNPAKFGRHVAPSGIRDYQTQGVEDVTQAVKPAIRAYHGNALRSDKEKT